jgi:D-sedoheptulose 7-phosphate isomerase
LISEHLETLAQTLTRVPCEPIEEIVAVLQRARREGKRVLLMGNGGSAATASHFVNDLLKGATQPGQPRFKVMCLADNVSTLTAYANDTSYEMIFAEPLRALAEAGDVVLALSGSGNSPNVLRAMDAAKELGLTRLGLAGFAGGKLKAQCDVCVVVPSDSMQIIEDVHLAILHSVFRALGA